jgi:hypothetical protein
MHDPQTLHMLQRSRYLIQVHPNAPFFQELLPRIGLSDELFQVSFLSPLHHNEHFVCFNKGLDVSGYEFVLQLLHELHLFNALVSLLLVIHIKNLS